MNVKRMLWGLPLALFAAASTGCSLLKVAVATGDPLSKEEMNVRTMTRGFYYDMAGEVARAADSIIGRRTVWRSARRLCGGRYGPRAPE